MQRVIEDHRRKSTIWIFAFFLLVLIAVYFPVLNSGPLWDDWIFLFKSWTLKVASPLDFWKWGEYRRSWPLFYSSLSLMHKAFGENVLYYHLVNLILHAANASLVYYILKRLKGNYSFLLSFIFLIHPLHFFTVSWIIQIKTLLATFFFLLTLITFISNEVTFSWRRYLVSLVLFACSLASKVVFAPVLILSVFYKTKIKIIPYLIVALYFVSLTTWSSHLKDLFNSTNFSIPFISKVYAQEDLVDVKDNNHIENAKKLILTLKNYSKYSAFIFYPWRITLVQPTTSVMFSFKEMLQMFGAISFTFLLFYLWWKRRDMISLLGFSFYIISIIPLCGLITIPIFHYSNFIDYWLSVPVLGIILCLSRLKESFKIEIILVLFVLFLGGTTVIASHQNNSVTNIVENSSKVSSDSPLIPLILAKHYFFTKEYVKSNEILIKAKKTGQLDNIKIDHDIEMNLKGMKGEEINDFSL